MHLNIIVIHYCAINMM